MNGDTLRKGKAERGGNPKAMTYQRDRNAPGMACGGKPVNMREPGVCTAHGTPAFRREFHIPAARRRADPILGRSRINLNEYSVAGGSGHGFKHGPALGEYVAGLVTQSGTTDLRFSLTIKGKADERAVF